MPLGKHEYGKNKLGFISFDYDNTLTIQHTWKDLKFTKKNRIGTVRVHAEPIYEDTSKVIAKMEFFSPQGMLKLFNYICGQKLVCVITTLQYRGTVLEGLAQNGFSEFLHKYHNTHFFVIDRECNEFVQRLTGGKTVSKLATLNHVFGDIGGLHIDDDHREATAFVGSNVMFCEVDPSEGAAFGVSAQAMSPLTLSIAKLQTQFTGNVWIPDGMLGANASVAVSDPAYHSLWNGRINFRERNSLSVGAFQHTILTKFLL